MGSRNGVNDGKTFGSENQGNSINDEDCSGAATSSRDDTVDPSSKSYSRREALRQSQLTARGQHQPRRTSAVNSSSGVYSSGVPGSTPTTIARSPRHAERRRSSSLLQAKADIVAGTSIKSQTDDDCIYKTTGECEMAKQGAFSLEREPEMHLDDSVEEISDHQQNYATLDLPVALTVDIEDTTQWLPSAVEYDLDAKPAIKKSSHVRPLMCCMTLCFVCCTIAVMLTVIAHRSGCGSGCSAREFIGIQEFVSLFLGKAVSLDEDSQTAYTKALHWIVHKDPQRLDLGSGGRILQRFVLATVFFASNIDEGHSVTDDVVSWLSEESECEWDGITCDSLGQVRSIDLIDFNRIMWIRTIPPEFWKLPFLQRVALPFGSLENADTPFGSNETAELKHLSTLNLRGNNLGTSVSDDTNGNDALKFRSLRSLKHADLGRNKLEGNVDAAALFSTVDDVKVLLLDSNNFSGLLPIQRDSRFHNLHRLNVAQNKFSGTVFRSFDALPRLNEIALNDNLFVGALPELDPHSPLSHFEAGNNRFNGSIPESLVSSSRLDHLGLSFNLLHGMLPPIRAPRLRHFDVHGNRLSGSLEGFNLGDEVGSLQYYDVSLNSLEGSMESVCTQRIPSAIISDCLQATECTCCTKCCHSGTGRCVDMI